MREVGEQICNGAVAGWVMEARGNFGEGGEDEAAFVESWMGEG